MMNALNVGSRQGLAKIFLLANGLFLGVLLLGLWVSYGQHLQYAQERAENTTLTLEKTVSGMFEQIDMLLIAMANELDQQLAAGQADAKRLNRTMVHMGRQVKHLQRIAYSDANGLVAMDAGVPVGLKPTSIEDRDYFRQLRANPDAGLVTSAPLLGRTSGKWVLIFARSYKNPEGQFAGVVYASVELEGVSNLFANLKLGQRAAVNLLSDHDYRNLVRYPPPKDPSVLGQRVLVQTFVDKMKEGKPFVAFIETSKVDNVEKVYALRKLHDWPYFVLLGLSTEEELAPWRKQLGLALFVMLVFAGLTGSALWQLRRGWRSQENALATLGATLEATDNGILVVDVFGNVLHRNQRFLQLWGIPQNLADSCEDSALLDYVVEQLVDPQKFRQGVKSIYASAEAAVFDTLEFKDGRVFERSSMPMRLNGKLNGRVWSFRDVSQRKQADELLDFIAQRDWVGTGTAFLPALAQRLGALLRLDYVSIARLTDDPGIMETVGFFAHGAIVKNVRYAMAGTPCENVVGSQLCLYPDGVQQSFPSDAALADMKVQSYLGIPLWDSEGRAVGLIAGLNSKPLNQAEQATAMFRLVAAAAGFEIERLREEALLRQERDRAQSYLDTVEATIVVLDREGRVSHINRKGCELLGWQESELIGHSWFERCLPQPMGYEEVYPYFRKLMAGELDAVEYFENEVLTQSGAKRHVAWHNALLRNADGSVIGTLSAGDDITERKMRDGELEVYRHQLEELVNIRTQELGLAKELAESSNRAKSVFLANMSHELRTPLNSILGFARLLEKSAGLDGESKRQLATINRSGQHLLALINDVLEISRIEAGRIEIKVEPFALPELLGEVTDMIRLRAKDKRLQFELDCAPTLPHYVLGDAHHLRQILINLLGNAVKYTDHGHVGLRVSTSSGMILFEVSDSGQGIAAVDQGKLFKAFYQTAAGIAKGEGTGLGLAICQEYARLMAGELSLQSELGKGSVFTLKLSLPVADQAPKYGATRGARVLGLAPESGSPRVLVVDDKADNRELVCQMLGSVGFAVQSANDGKEAIDVFGQWQPQFIWMDMRMPVMDGYEATRRIRALPGGTEVSIVALTASAFEEDRLAIMEAGCDALIKKPVQEEQLFDLMGALLGVRYRFAQEPAATLAPSELDLSMLPMEWLAELKAAAERLDVDASKGVLARVAKLHPACGAGLAALLEGFRFDVIGALCEKNLSNA